MVRETEEEEEEEEDGLEYTTDTPSGGSYTTPPSTEGHLSPSLAPSRSPTPGDSNPENNAALRMEELEAHIDVRVRLPWVVYSHPNSRESISTRGDIRQ